MDATGARISINLPATREYRRWLAGLARRLRESQAGVIDRALEVLAGEVGHPGPPMRTPGHGSKHEGHDDAE